MRCYEHSTGSATGPRSSASLKLGSCCRLTVSMPSLYPAANIMTLKRMMSHRRCGTSSGSQGSNTQPASRYAKSVLSSILGKRTSAASELISAPSNLSRIRLLLKGDRRGVKRRDWDMIKAGAPKPEFLLII